MKLPTRLKIWGHNFKLKHKKDLKYYNGKDTVGALGLFLYNDQEIHLNSVLLRESSREVETLLHELIHSVNYFSNTFRENEKELEERVTDTLANGLTLVFKDNPELVDYIRYKLHGDNHGRESQTSA